jgi:tricorn protease
MESRPPLGPPLIRAVPLAILSLLASVSAAQVSDPMPKEVFGARSLALSPDGSRLSFSWRGDLWIAPADGGKAVALTSHVELEDNPIFSPDGKWIAFSSNRNGGQDIYVVPSDGGEAARITWHPGSETPTGWTADSRQVVFRAAREGEENGIFSIDIRTLDIRQLLRDHRTVGNPKVSPDGKTLLFTRYGFPWTRPRYQGSAALQLLTMDMASGERKELRNNGFQHLWPTYLADGRVAAVSVEEVTPSSSPLGKPIPKIQDSALRTPNIHVFGPGRAARRITSFVGGPVRFLAAASESDRLAFEQEGRVYVMSTGSQPRAIKLTANVDDKFNNEERQVLTSGASSAALSPDGKTFVITAANELWSVPVEQGKRPNSRDAKQLTNWPGLDGSPIWAPDGKAVFFTSDRDGAVRLYRMVIESGAITPITKGEEDVLELQITPDRKHVSFWVAGSRGGLYKVSVDGGDPVKVFDLPRPYRYESDTSYHWSPDGRYVAYSLRRPTTSVNIYIHDTKEGKSHNITRMVAFHGAPAFSPDGKYLYFVGSRQQTAIYVVPLGAESQRQEDVELKYEKPKETPKVEIDFDQIHTRIRVFLAGDAGGLEADPETGRVIFQRDGSIWTVDYDGQNARPLAQGGIDSFLPTLDWTRLVFVKDGLPQFLDLRRQNTPVTAVNFQAVWVKDVRGERRAAFAQFWREYNRTFYDPNFHGRDWVALRSRYEPFLDSVAHRNEFATVLNMMVGELEASHAEVGPAGGGPSTASVGHLGVTFDYSYRGPGIRVASVPARTPGSFTQTRIGVGEVILEINGAPAKLNESLWRSTLLGQAGRDVTLTVVSQAMENRRTVRIRALSGGEWNGILYRNRIESRRKLVEEKSGGLLTYLEIPGMGGEQLRNFNFEAWEFIAGKKGVIIDVRNNGGGNISDDLIDLIERRPHGLTQLRDSDVEPSPGRSWSDDLKVIVMISETSFSDAELYPSGMKARGFATLLGMPTPGYVIGTYGLPLLDGTSARMPAWAWFRLDGSNTENNGQKPDIKVDWPAEDYLRGVDPQLDRAISELLRQIQRT